MKYRTEIDGLRAIAVLPVILFHAGFLQFSGGFIGVDIFFVISGYLITTILMEEIAQGRFSIIRFYERRARRILPALFLVLAACLPLAYLILSPDQIKNFAGSLSAVTLFGSNIFFWKHSGYFDTSSLEKPLLHTWSLAVEEQYYLLFPIFLFMAWRLGKRWIVLLIVLMAATSLGLAQWGAYHTPNANFYLAHSRAWELFAGSLCAFFIRHYGVRSNNPIAILGMVLISIALFCYQEHTPYPSFYTLVPVLGTAFIICCAGPDTLVGKLLSWRLLVGIGLVSYSAYLWHQPLIVFTRIATFNESTLLIKIALVALSLILAYVSWRWVEAPFRNKQRTSTPTIWKFSAAGLVIFFALGMWGYWRQGWVLSSPTPLERHMLQAMDDWDYPGSLHATPIKGLYIQNPNKPIDTLFYGDSHAEQYGPAATELAKQGVNIAFLTGGGCPILPNVYEDKHVVCKDLAKRFDETLKTHPSIKNIVLSNCFQCYLVYVPSNPPQEGSSLYYYLEDGKRLYFYKGKGIEESLRAFKSWLTRLSKHYHVTAFLDTPQSPRFDPRVMMKYLYRKAYPYFQKRYPDYGFNQFALPLPGRVFNQKMGKLLADIPHLHIVNMSSVVCPQGQCHALLDGQPIFKDAHHFRPFYARKLSEYLLSVIKQ